MNQNLARVCVVLAGLALRGQDQHGFGPVEPVPIPEMTATRHDGVRVALREVFQGRRSAVQFVFVDCTTACPILGSLFRKVDKSLAQTQGQLVSITVNPERDTAARMAGWLAQFQASERWIGLRLEPADLRRLLQVFKQEAGPPTGHTLQVFLVDDAARYAARTIDMPSAASVAAELRIGMSGGEAPELSTRLGAASGREVYDGRGGVLGTVGADRLDSRASRCSGCHGARAEGGAEGKTVAPALTREALLTVRERRGGPSSAYTERTFCEGLRRGVDPAGVRYSDMMPRYQIDGRTCHSVWQFLTQPTGAK